jgi:hypothetical protein
MLTPVVLQKTLFYPEVGVKKSRKIMCVEVKMVVKTWMLGYREGNLDKVKRCPACGSERLDLPNDLWEWICLDCGCWFALK